MQYQYWKVRLVSSSSSSIISQVYRKEIDEMKVKPILLCAGLLLASGACAFAALSTNSAKGALSDPEPVCVVFSLGDSSVNIRQSTYCNPPDYWDIYFYNMEQGKKALDKAGVNIPFPQMDVFIKNK